MQQVASGPVNVPRAFDRLVRLRATEAWLLILFCMDLVAIGDLATGPDLWLGPVYLLVICCAAWTAGWLAGQLTGIACMMLTFAINGVSLYPYGSSELFWNFTMRFLAVSVLIAVIAGVRRTYVREWWLARTDPLTRALNRQAFFELASSAVSTQHWRLLVYADLDGLKKVNDQQGHAAGDAALKVYADDVRRSIRQTDIFARVGGDEFLIFMQVKNEAAGRGVASRLHRQVNGAPRGLHCSFGALVIPPGEVSLDDLVRRTDNLMYEAKLRGADLELAIASDVSDISRRGRTRRDRSTLNSAAQGRWPERRTSVGASALERAPR